MRVLTYAAIVGAIASASPASAQYNEAAPATNATEANEATPANTVSSEPAAPTAAGGQTAAVPSAATAPAESGTAPIVAEKGGFPWGVLGLLGLLGLFRRRRSSS